MNPIYRKIFQYSLTVYVAITMYTRFADGPKFDFISRFLYSLPWDFFGEGKTIKFQTHLLSGSQVAEFIKTNSITSELFTKNTNPPQYLVLRYWNTSCGHWGDLKVYFSNFKYPSVLGINSHDRTQEPCDLIIPIPKQGVEKPCEITLHWKNFWGGK